MQPGYKPEPADTFTRFVGKFRSKCWAVGSEWQKKYDIASMTRILFCMKMSLATLLMTLTLVLIILDWLCYIILFILFVIIIPGVKCYCSIDVPRDRLTFPTTFQSPPPSTMINQFCDDWWRLMTATTRSGYILHCTVYYEYDSCYA